jgi:hypothetical protein
VGRVADKVVLIDGETLANLMIDHSVGVSLQRSYAVKLVDSDYFSEARRDLSSCSRCLMTEIDDLTTHMTSLPQLLQRQLFPSSYRTQW